MASVLSSTRLDQSEAELFDDGAVEQRLQKFIPNRRPLNIEFVQQQTIANKRRLEEKDPVARTKNFEQLAATSADPVAHRAYLLRASLLDSVRNRARVAA